MTHHYQDRAGWLAFAQLFDAEEEFLLLCEEQDNAKEESE